MEKLLNIFVGSYILKWLGANVRKLYFFLLDKPLPKQKRKKDYYERMVDSEGFIDTLIGFLTLLCALFILLFFTGSL